MFYLKNPPNKDGSRLIVLRYNYNSRRLRLSTSLTIHPDMWDEVKSRPKRHYKYYSEYKNKLDKYEDVTIKTYHELTLTRIPTKEEFADEIQKRFYPKSATLADFTRDLSKTKNPGNAKLYEALATDIEDFNPDLTFDEVEADMILDFMQFLYSRDLEHNTVVGKVNLLRFVMNAAVERGLTTNKRYLTKSVRPKRHQTTDIFLTEEELERMYRAELPEVLEKYRDSFIVASFTGVRHSDLTKLNAASFKGQSFRILTQKNTQPVEIPVHPYVFEIMSRYNWQLPKLTPYAFNKYIKEVGRIAKIDSPTVETRHPGGKRVSETKPKWQMITVHSSRRSLACNMLIAGYSDSVVMACGGWKTYEAFKRYKKLTSTDFLKLAYKGSFFKKKKAM